MKTAELEKLVHQLIDSIEHGYNPLHVYCGCIDNHDAPEGQAYEFITRYYQKHSDDVKAEYKPIVEEIYKKLKE